MQKKNETILEKKNENLGEKYNLKTLIKQNQEM